MTKVKICGITNVEDARNAVFSGADELGFNFYEKSPRYISPLEARRIIEDLSTDRTKIGVFVNKPIEIVEDIARSVGLDGIQLHGDEDIEYARRIRQMTGKFVIKAFRVSPSFLVGDALDWIVEYPLFDTFSQHKRGGTGRAFDWKSFGDKISFWFSGTAYLAGGLNPDNVAEAIRGVRPYAVDVASGVETSPRKKDPKKMAVFIDRAKNP